MRRSPSTPAKERLRLPGKALDRVPVERDAVERAADRPVEPVPQGGEARPPRRRAPADASRTAAPKPTIPGTFSVPDRSPRSCPPPKTSGARATRGRALTQSAPTPFGP